MRESTASSGRAEIWEVGPRDGLQNEAGFIPTAGKVRMIEGLLGAGLVNIEITACVSPRWVPQMADHKEVIEAAAHLPEPRNFAVLVPNMRGMSAAEPAQVSTVSVFTAASEAFTEKNINCTIAESLERFRPIAERAKELGKDLRGYVSTAIACPYSGKVSPAAVAGLSADLVGLGCSEVSLGDTIGVGRPDDVRLLLRSVSEAVPVSKVACHFHDTHGNALDNVLAALDCGVRVFDSSIGGLGGCPYAPGAPGNVDTVEVAALLDREGYPTGLDTDRLAACADHARSLLGHVESAD